MTSTTIAGEAAAVGDPLCTYCGEPGADSWRWDAAEQAWAPFHARPCSPARRAALLAATERHSTFEPRPKDTARA